MKIKTILLLLALCVTMGVSSQGRIEPGNEVAIKLYKEAAKKEKKNPAYSLAMYESLAKDGYAPAQYIMYKKGKGDKWLELAAVGGHFEAATGNGFLSQRIKQCEQAVERSRACATRASNGEPISEQEIEMLWDERQVFDQVYRQMESMQGYLFAAAVAKDANFFPPYYKGKKDMKIAQWDLEALCSSCRDRLAQLQMEFGQQMDIIQESAKKTAMTANANGQLTDKTFTVKGVTFVMRPVAGGTFQMGYESYPLRNPPHSVTLSSYYIGQMEVTQALWQAVMGSNPSNFKGNYLPMETVSWDDCQTFITKLNQLTGQKFRLPTEAEWEYAARGGQKSKGYKYSGSDALDDLAWYWKNSGDSALSGTFTLDRAKANNGKTHPIAKMQANELGLYDMSGNVFEWCQDWFGENYYKNSSQTNPIGPTSGDRRVVRGGCWSSSDFDCRVYSRVRLVPSSRDNRIGFRLALSSNSSASTSTQKAATASTSTQKATTANTATQKTTMTAEEMLEKGEDYYGKQNYVEAVKWYRKAAEQGHALAQAALGACYLEGTGITKSEVEAAKWFRKAAEQGYAAAQNRMGLCYYSGNGVTKDGAEAVKWFRKAAEQGYAVAQYNLGRNYCEGTGVSQNKEEAKKWLRKAANQGYENAKQYLKKWFGEE